MIYAYKEGSKWNLASLMPKFNGVGGWHTLSDAERAKHKWYPCVEINANYDPISQIKSEPEFSLLDGVVTATYTIWDKPDSQIYSEAASEVRAKRQELITDTDYQALSDVTMSAEIKGYRQELRDITDHENFPNLDEEDWPTAP